MQDTRKGVLHFSFSFYLKFGIFDKVLLKTFCFLLIIRHNSSIMIVPNQLNIFEARAIFILME